MDVRELKNLTIGISTSAIEPAVNSGVIDGIGSYTQELKESLTALNYHVKGYAFPRSIITPTRFIQSTSLKIPFPPIALLEIITAGKLYKLNPSIDLFHSTDFKIVPMKCPVIATIWDTLYYDHPKWLSTNKIRQLATPLIFKKSAKFADRIITGSNYSATSIAKFYQIPEKNITVIPCAIEDTWLQKLPTTFVDQVLKKHKINPEYLLDVGTIQPKKNYARLLDAHLKLPEKLRSKHQLVIVGKTGACSEDISLRLKKLTCQGHIKWLTNIESKKELQALYQAAICFVFPSLHEGFGIPILEAFASRTPVITSNSTSLPEVCGDAALKINPLSVDEIYKALLTLLHEKSFREHLINIGSQKIEQYRWHNVLPQILDVYKDVL